MLPKGPLTVLNTATNLNTPSTLKYKNVLRVVSLIGPNLETPGFYSTKNPLNFRMTPKSEDPNCSRKPRSLWLLGTNAKPHGWPERSKKFVFRGNKTKQRVPNGVSKPLDNL